MIKFGDKRLPERFWDKVEVDSDSGCWRWTASLRGKGYAGYYHDGEKSIGHRVAYQILVGPIPTGLQLNHLCRVRNCVNPDHLEPVTHQEILRRGKGANHKTGICRNGHIIAKVGLYHTSPMSRHRSTCAQCQRESSKRYRDRKRREE